MQYSVARGVQVDAGAAKQSGCKHVRLCPPDERCLRSLTRLPFQRAQYIGAKDGLYKIVFDASSRRVLGVHVVSRGASDIVGALAVALGLGATVDDLAAVHHVYPSFSEGLKAAAEQAR